MTELPTTGPGTASGLARECVERGATCVIAAGGDGTVNEVANGLIPSNVPLAVLPAGTANVLAVELGIGTNPVAAAEQFNELTPERIAAGVIESETEKRHFLLMAGAGLDAMIVYHIDAALKARIGRAAYWVGGFSQLGRPLPEFEVQVDGETRRCSFALASRVRNYGGDITIARSASLFHEHFELVLFEGAHTLPYLRYLLGVLTGTLAQMKGVCVLQATEVELRCPADSGIYVQVDGEFAGRLPVRLRIVPNAVTLLMPRGFRDKQALTQTNG